MPTGCGETPLAALCQVPVTGQRAQCCSHLLQQFTSEDVVGQQGNENVKGSLCASAQCFLSSCETTVHNPFKKIPAVDLGEALNQNTCVSHTHSLAIMCRDTNSSTEHTRCLTPGKAGWTDQLAGEAPGCVGLSSSCHWMAFLCPCSRFSPFLQPLNPTQWSWSWITVKQPCWWRL